MSEAAKQEVALPEIRIIKTGTCQTLSGKSTLTYDIGSNPQGSILFRVTTNSGGGYFNQEWVSLADIQKVIEKAEYITSFSLRQLYAGKSTNSPGFLLAVIKALGLVKLKGEKERVYVALNATSFIAEMKALDTDRTDRTAKADSGAGSAGISKKGKKSSQGE